MTTIINVCKFNCLLTPRKASTNANNHQIPALRRPGPRSESRLILEEGGIAAMAQLSAARP